MIKGEGAQPSPGFTGAGRCAPKKYQKNRAEKSVFCPKTGFSETQNDFQAFKEPI